MKKCLLLCSFFIALQSSYGQTKNIELFDLIKKLIQDSTGYDVVGDWAVSKPNTYPIKWQADKIEMSDDIKINFYRKGTANILINGKNYAAANKTNNWNIMLTGARSGFSSFSISSTTNENVQSKMAIDSLLGKNNYTYKLLQDCSKNKTAGFYYYQLKLPKKTTAWIKISWNCNASGCAINLDCFDDWSKQYANVNCPK